MNRPVMVVNSGSSTIRCQLIEPDSGFVVAGGAVERIGEPGSRIGSHDVGMRAVFADLVATGHGATHAEVGVVGHRVVHGGEVFHDPVVITDSVIEAIGELSPLAPLHNPANVTGIVAARELLPGAVHVAVFDTGFFHDLPAVAKTYAIDADTACAHHIRRYGFHGTSHEYVSVTAARMLGRNPHEVNQVVLHLGNGASMSAIRAGRPVDTSMGLTPMAGLVMGTRCGDVDPGILPYLYRRGMTVDEIDDLLNHRSGMAGLCGVNDFRELRRLMRAGASAAWLAYDVYVHRIRHYLGAYLVELEHIDALVFTAGVGEHDAGVRSDVLAGLGRFGIRLDPERNGTGVGSRIISAPDSSVTVAVVATNEELEIARRAVDVASRTAEN